MANIPPPETLFTGVTVHVCQRCHKPQIGDARSCGSRLLPIKVVDYYFEVCPKCVEEIKAQFPPISASLQDKNRLASEVEAVLVRALEDIAKKVPKAHKPPTRCRG